MNCQKFLVRWLFVLVCVAVTSSMVWLVNRSTTSKANTNVDKIEDARQILTNEILSTRTLMIEKQLGRPLIVDPNMPYIGYLKPEEWRKYDLPEGIGIGRGSRGKQRNKFGLKKTKPRTKPKEKTSSNNVAGGELDPNELFFHAALDEGVKAHVAVVENEEEIVMSQKDEDQYQAHGLNSEDQGGESSQGDGNEVDFHGD